MVFTPQARWLGYLSHAASSGQTLSAYAKAQHLSLDELLALERRLSEFGVTVPQCVRPARLIAVEVVT